MIAEIAILAQAATTGNDGDSAYLLYGAVLVAATVLLLFAELMVPSGGLIGILAGICAIGSVICFFQYDTVAGAAAVGAYIIFGPIVVVAGFKFWLNSPLSKRFVLGDRKAFDGDEDAAEKMMASEHARTERLAALRDLIGEHGEAVTALRPVGTVKIAGRRIDALAELGVIESGTRIVVTDVYDNQIKVRAAER